MTHPQTSRARMIADKAELYVAGLFFVIMLGVVVANVFLRYLLSTGLLFTEELAYLGFSWSVFPAIAWLYRTRMLISVDVFFELLPRRLQRSVSALVDLTLVGANLWFCWLSWVLAAGGFVRRTPVLEVPYFWINLAPLLAFGLMAFYSAVHFVQRLRGSHPTSHPGKQAELCEGSSP
ncbi:TRAP transporter small permease (plasmid) [Ensifer sp. D2-11]